jgi:hypothetical protein
MTRRTLEANIHRLTQFLGMQDHSFGDMDEIIAPEVFLYHVEWYLDYYLWLSDFTVFLPLKEYLELLKWAKKTDSVMGEYDWAGPHSGGATYNKMWLREDHFKITDWRIRIETTAEKGRKLTSTFQYVSRYKLLFKTTE